MNYNQKMNIVVVNNINSSEYRNILNDKRNIILYEL